MDSYVVALLHFNLQFVAIRSVRRPGYGPW